MPLNHTVTFTCTTCGNVWQDKWIDPEDESLPGCSLCTVGIPRKGKKIRFSCAHRVPSDAPWAREQLEENGVYTIKSFRQYQHFTSVVLMEIPHRSFNLWMFSDTSYQGGAK